MLAHWRYLLYVLKHKWHVFVGCWYLGVPLHQAIIHDWTKFLPREWFAYVAKFYGVYPVHDPADPDKWQRRGYFGPTTREIAVAFDIAWNHHQKRQPHHWQYWLLITDSDDPRLRALPMPERFVREMVADWYGAGRAITGKKELATWYAKNKDRIILADVTRVRVAQLLDLAAQRGLIDAQAEPDPFYTLK